MELFVYLLLGIVSIVLTGCGIGGINSITITNITPNIGAPGSNITINGSFESDVVADIIFQSTESAARVNVTTAIVSDNSIAVIVPEIPNFRGGPIQV